MPISYQLPSWLGQTTDPGAKFLSGLQVGASIGEARNRLAAQQQQFAVEAQQKQDTITASALKEAQELQVSKAYNDQQVALKQQALEIADKKVGAETMKAARQYQAQQAYQTDYQAGLDEGLTEEEAARSALFKNLSTFGAHAGTAARALAPAKTDMGGPRFFKDPNSGATIAMGPKGHILRTDTGRGQSGQPGFWTKFDATNLNREKQALTKAQTEDVLGDIPTNKAYQQRKNRISEIDASIEKMKAQPTTPTGVTMPTEDDTIDEEDTSTDAGTGRVAVISPQGVVGDIPSNQLPAALKAGYTQVK